MGYYTRYELEIYDNSKDIACETEVAKGKSAQEIYENEMDYNPFYDECKWYSWRDDMKVFSRKYPKTIWLLSGEGEESGDVWRSYWKNGKNVDQMPEVKWPQFNPAELSD